MGIKLLSFLGTNRYDETTYYKEEKQSKSRFIQKALYDLLDTELTVVLFLTEQAKIKNWLGTGMNYPGLQQEFQNAGIQYRIIDILEGKNEEEMWINFERIYSVLEEKDKIYADVTHSFRSIPFMFMAVLNYGKFIKNIDVAGIFYGAYEAKQEDRTPVFDLSMFDKLSEWTVTAEKLISTGDGENFSKLIDKTVSPILKATRGADTSAQNARKLNKNLIEYSYALKSSRGDAISKLGVELKQSLQELKAIEIGELKPFEKIVDKILDKVCQYNGDLFNDIHYTICLCRDFKLIQQAYTLLTENILNYVCIHGQLDIKNSKINGKPSREIAKDVLLSFHNLHQDNIQLTEYERMIREKLQGKLGHELADLFKQVSSDYRNDLNHAGYRQDAKNYEKFVLKLNDFIHQAEELMGVQNTSSVC